MKIYSSVLTGSLKIKGDIEAENYITKTTVTSITQSFSSGSTLFGDSSDDTHLFIGSKISGSATSTGSFQTIRFGPPARNFRFYESGNDAYFGGSGLRIGSNFAFRINGGESLSTGGTATITRIDNVSSNIYFAIGGDGGSGDTALLINTENQNYLGLGLRTNSGLNTPDVIKIHDEAGYGGLGANVVEFATGSLVVSSGNISGSSTSTGSFAVIRGGGGTTTNNQNKVSFEISSEKIYGVNASYDVSLVDGDTRKTVYYAHSGSGGYYSYLGDSNGYNFGYRSGWTGYLYMQSQELA